MGPADWIMGGIVATVLVATTACGGATTAAEAPPSGTTSPSSAVSASPTAIDNAGDGTPLDPSTVTAVDDAVVKAAGYAQPAYATKALDLLSTLAIKGRAPKTGYDRAQFGQAWADVDRNGCDTRNDILRRDLTGTTLKPGTRDCVVLTGTLNDHYTAAIIHFTRGPMSSSVQIDHVVALGDAWQKGAQQLTMAQRTSFANDPLNLLAVSGPANQQKGAGDAATWLPSNKSYRCDYVARQISVKASYKLWVTQAEHDAMATVLGNCAGTLVPTNQPAPGQSAPAAAPPAEPAPAAAQQAPAVVPVPVQQAAPAAPVAPVAPAVVAPVPAAAYYANCTAVRAAGAAPIYAGQAGYSTKLDRDGDGIACE
jgi:hypothetical protein